MKRYWNKFLNWIIPGRRVLILARMIQRNQELGLYDKEEK